LYVYPLLDPVSTPILVTLHSRFPFDRVASWLGDADQYYLDWLASVPMVAISESAREDVPHRLNFIGVIHHGLPTETFSPTVEQPEDFLFWLGRFVPEKGPHLAIEAAKACGRPLVLAGTIDQHVPEAVAYFEQMIKPQLDGQQIRYVGPVGMQEKIDWFSRAYGLLNPIEWKEPFGMVIIEAMSVGCPVISFAQGSVPELVSHGKSGFLVDDLNEMIHYIGKLETLNRNVVRAHVEQNFSVRVMVEKYTKAYRQSIKLAKTSNTLVSHQMPVPLVRKAPPTTSTPIMRSAPSPFAPSQMPSRLKASPMSSPFVRSEPPTEPDVESLP
jgi:glycosyltransferase involved in cell wall biosynthesis